MSSAQLKPLTDIMEMESQSSVDIDPAFMKPEDFCDASNSGGQKYDKKKAQVERMLDFVEEKEKLIMLSSNGRWVKLSSKIAEHHGEGEEVEREEEEEEEEEGRRRRERKRVFYRRLGWFAFIFGNILR